jgi:UDP-N-acetyl-D-mannosaminuronate dehydrogenase
MTGPTDRLGRSEELMPEDEGRLEVAVEAPISAPDAATDVSGGPEAPVLVVGLGEVGKPLLAVLEGAHRVAGRDVENHPFRGVQILHLCYPFGPDFVSSASRYASMYGPEVVVVNSTVVPGTSRTVEEATGIPTVYSPVRGKHTGMKEELLRYKKWVAGTHPEAVGRVEDHFRAAGMVTGRMSSFEVLELAKLLETSYFGILLAWAQEMDRFAADLGADYWEAVQLTEDIDFFPPVTFEPGHIGGHCVMPNLELLERVRKSLFIDVIRRSNADRLRELQRSGRPLDERLVPRRRR